MSSNLPVQLTSFVGRETEIAAVQGLLHGTRLLTLTGSGGCGKTRLALRVAAEVADDRYDDVWWVDLAALADAALVGSTIAAALGVREALGEAVVDTLARHLGQRCALVLLDNCEHLVAATAALTEELLLTCPTLTVLATSREPLGVDGEVTWRVPSLTLPPRPPTTVEALTGSEAGRLFVERATHARPDFRVTHGTTAAVTEICHRLDGIPLAIELAASRTRVLTAEQIADGLHDRFRLLTGGARSALPRQRTLEASVAWSHALLGDDERVVFRRLAAFAGGFTLDAAEAVCAGDGIERRSVLDLVTALVDRSLVHVDDAGPQARYRLLETIRHYARHELVAANETEAVHDRHLDFYLALAEEAAPHLMGSDMPSWLRRLDDELDNLRAAMDWGHSSDPVAGLRLAERLHWFWRARSAVEGRGRLETALADVHTDGADTGRALIALASLSMFAGDMPHAQHCAREALDIGRQLGDDHVAGSALSFLGWLAILTEPDPTTAPDLLDEAFTTLQAAGDPAMASLAANALGFAHTATSRSAEARALYDQGAALGRSAGWDRPLMEGELWRGWLDLFEGDFAAADTHATRALDVSDWPWDPFFHAIGHLIRGEAALYQGRYHDAQEQFHRGLDFAANHRDAFGEAELRRGLGLLHHACGDLDAATADLDRAATVLDHLDLRGSAHCQAIRAHIELTRSQPDTARAHADQALTLARSLDHTRTLVHALTAHAELCRLDGRPDRAEDLLHDALDAAVVAGHAPGVANALEGLAAAVADQARPHEATRLLAAAQTARDALGYVRFPVATPGHDRLVAELRDALGPDGFDTAWTDGTSITTDEAIAYARRGRGRRKRPTHGWASLTPTEERIVAHVAEGLTNPQIGQRMFISPRTVQTHLAHIFTKLDIATRAELATKAATRPRGTAGGVDPDTR